VGLANSRWPRWVVASFAKHVHAAAEVAEVPLVVELLDDRSKEFLSSRIKAEATISGPRIQELSAGLWRIQVTVFVVISSDRQTDANAYDHLDVAGVFLQALAQCVEVKEYGISNPDPAHVGYLDPRTGQGDEIDLQNLRPGEKDQQSHTVLEVDYLGYFSQGDN
jgi:hypothetical protein